MVSRGHHGDICLTASHWPVISGEPVRKPAPRPARHLQSALTCHRDEADEAGGSWGSADPPRPTGSSSFPPSAFEPQKVIYFHCFSQCLPKARGDFKRGAGLTVYAGRGCGRSWGDAGGRRGAGAVSASVLLPSSDCQWGRPWGSPAALLVQWGDGAGGKGVPGRRGESPTGAQGYRQQLFRKQHLVSKAGAQGSTSTCASSKQRREGLPIYLNWHRVVVCPCPWGRTRAVPLNVRLGRVPFGGRRGHWLASGLPSHLR